MRTILGLVLLFILFRVRYSVRTTASLFQYLPLAKKKICLFEKNRHPLRDGCLIGGSIYPKYFFDKGNNYF